MGSTGIGSFTDYSESKPKTPETGGASGEDQCGKAFSTNLEEVPRCDYYIINRNVPAPGTEVEVYLNKRLFVRTKAGVDVGILPTKFNYLKYCMEDEFQYYGVVQSSTTNPLPSVTVDITPHI
jgi:hypothetical protein